MLSQEEIKWLYNNLNKVNFFSNLSLFQIERLIGYFQKYVYKEGEIVIRENTPGKALFIIYKGRVEVLKNKFLVFKKVLAELKEGDFFGEMALIDETSLTTATVKIVEPTELFILFRNIFLDLLKKNPELQKEINFISEKRKFEQLK